MARQQFDPKNPVYPPGCFEVTSPPNKVIFRDPNNIGVPELNFNNYMFFGPTGKGGTLQLLSDQCIRDIIRSPESPWESELDGKQMIVPSGIPAPAHLPNLVDIVGRINIVDVFKKLNKGDSVDVSYDTSLISEVIPCFLESLINPTPDIDVAGPVYPLTAKKVETSLACYSDGFQVYYLHAKLSEIVITTCVGRIKIDPFLRFMDVALDCSFKKGSPSFDLGSSIVVWNAHGVTRPSFKGNLIDVVAVHNPIIYIKTELRVGRKNFEEVVKVLGNEVDWSLDESIGICGGVAVIWNERKVSSGEFVVAVIGDCPSRVLGVLMPAAAGSSSAAAGEGSGSSATTAGEGSGSSAPAADA
ncbi:uncharacterized protein LOC110740264 [Chenopodium quinoa]|uniref:uncharacterized protein LOC110740264 n=1 Tax=Chenopodium quinoa TaxID=63459 RepID=UPI000B796C9A|nr:uncharacterized protein LOC110740264 [Chenopodium quinoa]